MRIFTCAIILLNYFEGGIYKLKEVDNNELFSIKTTYQK